ncbi:MAG: hypothetical protein E7518_02500 [Ruminococcaceae bacterium]|nr:hypothetical protein [Oscillospiraceae bacterium]HHV31780.1 hypothetical protein [Clostridiales bacterium]
MTKPQTWKPESFDLMQYFYSRVHQPLIHVKIELDGCLNETLLKKSGTLYSERHSAAGLPV